MFHPLWNEWELDTSQSRDQLPISQSENIYSYMSSNQKIALLYPGKIRLKVDLEQKAFIVYRVKVITITGSKTHCTFNFNTQAYRPYPHTCARTRTHSLSGSYVILERMPSVINARADWYHTILSLFLRKGIFRSLVSGGKPVTPVTTLL